MTVDERFGSTVSTWLRERAGSGSPDYLDDILGRTASTRQRPGWTFIERWLPMDLTIRSSTIAPPHLGRLLVTILVLIAIAALTILAVGAQPRRLPPPFGPAENGMILSSNSQDILISNADGSNRRVLIGGPTNDTDGWHSHDGTRFIFARHVDDDSYVLMQANADGSDLRQLLGAPLDGADKVEWSPQDDRLAIVHVVDNHQVLSVLDLSTGQLRTLPVPGDLEVDYDVLWRPPDGDELIFTARRNATSSSGAALYSIRPDGTNFRTIVPERREAWPFLTLTASPDGKTLSYWMYQAVPGTTTLHARVHLVDLATNADRTVVFDPENVEESELLFSPDGRSGVILSATDTATLQLVTLDPLAAGPVIGPDLAGNEEKSSGFSPDGSQVVLAIDGRPPMFIDVATHEVTTLDASWDRFDSWQRLALP